MKIPFLLVLLCCFLAPFCVAAQGENNIWMLTNNVGLDFNKASPEAFIEPAPLGRPASCASVSDASGSLLFYTNGFKVWNRFHQVMPNGDGLSSHVMANSKSAVAPVPGNSDLYVLFTVNSTYELSYSMIDMRQDTGRGDIISGKKSIKLADSISSGMQGVRGSGCYNWMLAHHVSTPSFYAFKIDGAGVVAAPVISRSGFYDRRYAYFVCDLQFTADAGRIAIASDGGYFVELHDFNAGSGLVGNQVLIADYGLVGRAHSACFSADGSKLYVSGGPNGDDLVQYDLDRLPLIVPERLNDDAHYVNGGVRRGPDGRIYSQNWAGMYTIMSPNLAGAAADLRYDYISLPAGATTSPDFMGTDIVGQPAPTASSSRTDTLICDVTTTIKGPAGYQSFLWSDGDTASSKLLFQNGLFWLQSLSGCDVRRDTFNLTFSHCNCLVSIPNAFSPNNDGRNDVFQVLGNEIEAIELNICNRWGQRVFHTVNNSNTVGWDGTFKGGDCDPGVYYYWLRVRCVKGQVVFRKGDITLLR